MATGLAGKELNELRVLVTRPVGQAERLCNMIAERGGIALRLPAIPPSVFRQ